MHPRAHHLALLAAACALGGTAASQAASQTTDGACAQPYVYAVNPVCQPLPNGQTQCQTIAMVGPAPGCAAPGSFRLQPVPMTPPVLMPPPVANPYLPSQPYMPAPAYNPAYNPYLPAQAYPAPPMVNPYLQAQALQAQALQAQMLQAQALQAQAPQTLSAPMPPATNPYLPQQPYPAQAAVPPAGWTLPWQTAPTARAPEPVAVAPAPAMSQPPSTPAAPASAPEPVSAPVPVPAPAVQIPAQATPAAALQPAPQPAPAAEVHAAPENDDALAHFAFASAKLTEAGRAALDAWLARVPKGKPVRVTGHADRLGPSTYNLKLSKRRAQAVRHYLIDKGLAPRRIRLEAKGEAVPVKRCPGKAGPATKRCLAPNRRVVIDPR